MFSWFFKKHKDSQSSHRRQRHTEAIFEYRSTKIWMNGHEVSTDAVDDNMLQQIASQSGMSMDQVREMILGRGNLDSMTMPHSMSHNANEVTAVESKGPIRLVECTACNRTVVDRKGFCMYCGHVFQAANADEVKETVTQQPVKQDVDAKFLKGEVEGTQSQQQEERGKQSFLQRLLRM